MILLGIVLLLASLLQSECLVPRMRWRSVRTGKINRYTWDVDANVDMSMDDDDTRIIMDSILEQTLNTFYGTSTRASREMGLRAQINCHTAELLHYHNLYGNLLIPPTFIFALDDDEFGGVPLGDIVAGIRQQYWQTNDYTMTDADKRLLLSLGFEFKHSRAQYALRYHELCLFKQFNGNLLIDRGYVVPHDGIEGGEVKWPYPHRGSRLGQVVKNIRNKNTFSEHREDLEALGLVFDGKCALILRAIEVYLKNSLHSDCGDMEKDINNVPVRWKIPAPPDPYSNRWPSELHGLRLGEALRRIRKKGAYAKYISEFTNLGLQVEAISLSHPHSSHLREEQKEEEGTYNNGIVR